MSILWMIVIFALWVCVLLEMGFLFLSFKGLGQLQQQIHFLTARFAPMSTQVGLDIGEKAPPFTAINDKNTIFSLDDSHGKKRLLLFVLPGCSACGNAIAAVKLLYQEKQDISILVIGGIDQLSNNEYAIKYQMPMPILTPKDPTTLHDIYHIPGVPFAFVLDEKGIIHAKGGINTKEHLDGLYNMTVNLSSFQLSA